MSESDKQPHHPDWLNLDPLDKKEESKPIKQDIPPSHFPDWLNLDPLEIDDSNTPNTTVTEDLPPSHFPDWLDLDPIPSSDSESSSTDETTPDHLSDNSAPDWSLEAPPSVKYAKNAYQNRTAESILEYKRDYLSNLGYGDLTEYANDEAINILYQQLKYIYEKHNIILSPEELDSEKITGIIRELSETESILELQDFLNDFTYDYKELNPHDNFTIPKLEDFDFKKRSESDNYVLSHIILDIETDKQSQYPCSIGCFNLEAKRNVVGVYDKSVTETQIQLYKYQDYDFIHVRTNNLWEALLIADVENVLGCILLSALKEGQNDMISVLKDSKILQAVPVKYDLLYEILQGNPQRKSQYIAHHSFFDINQLNKMMEVSKGEFSLFSEMEHERIPLWIGTDAKKKDQKTNGSIDKYYIKLGNAKVGFRFKIKFDKRFGHGLIRTSLTPAQRESEDQSYFCDTIITSFSLQNPKHSLAELSKDLKWSKQESDYDFIPEDFTLEPFHSATEYLLHDLYATLCVYEKATDDLNFDQLAELLEITFHPSKTPKISKICSTASIAKLTVFAQLEKLTSLSQPEIENNIERQRTYQKNFEKNYAGGRTEAFAYGIFSSTEHEKIKYYDFESLYPSISRCVYAQELYVLSATNQLHQHISYDKDIIKKNFWKTVHLVIDHIKKLQPLPDSIFKDLIGNALVKSKIKLLLRKTTASDSKIDSFNKGNLSLHLIDLLTAVVRSHIEYKTSLETLQSKITFLKGEYIQFSENPAEFGDEFFTKLLTLRRDNKTDEFDNYNPIEKMLKYVMNSSYGISGEGINKEDVTGKLFIPAIFASITAGSRFLTSIAEITFRKHDIKPLYTDTDSIIVFGSLDKMPKILDMFKNLSILKEETDYGIIHHCFISKKKKYAFITENPDISKVEHLLIEAAMYVVGKTHGKMQYPKAEFVETIFNIYKDSMQYITQNLGITKSIKRAINNHYKKFPCFSSITFKSKEDSRYKGIEKFYLKKQTYKKKKEPFVFPAPSKLIKTYQFRNVTMFLFYNIVEDKFLLTNMENKPYISNFGLYLNLKKLKIFYTPMVKNYKEFEVEFHQFLQNIFVNDTKDIWLKVRAIQLEMILKYQSSSKNLYINNTIMSYLRKPDYWDETGDDDLTNGKILVRAKKLLNSKLTQLEKDIIAKLPIPLSKHGLYYSTSLFYNKRKKLKDKEAKLYDFASDVVGNLLVGDNWDSIEVFDLPANYLSYLRTMGCNLISKSKYRKLNDIEKRKSLRRNSNQLESLSEKVKELQREYDFQNEYEVIDYFYGTELCIYYYESMQMNTLAQFFKDDVDDREKYEYTEGYHYFRIFIAKIKDQINKVFLKRIHKDKLHDYFKYDCGKLNRVATVKNHNNYILEPFKDIHKLSEIMATCETINKLYKTDGAGYRYYVKLPNISTTTEFQANQNRLYTQNIINISRIGSLIYYKTHKQPQHLSKVWDKRPEDLVCPKTNATVQIPIRFRKMPVIPEKPQYNHELRHFPEDRINNSEVLRFFDDKEIKNLTHRNILKKKKDYFIILKRNKFIKLRDDIIDTCWLIFSTEEDNYSVTEHSIVKRLDKQFLNNNFALEICKNDSFDYNAKLLLFHVVGKGKNRGLQADIHINPTSRNLLNMELFETTISTLEDDTDIIKDMMINLFSYKELSLFNRNASVTLTDLKKKDSLFYLREIMQLTLTHQMILKSIPKGTCKLGNVAISGNIELPKRVRAKTLMSLLISSIIDKFNTIVKTYTKKEQIQIRNKLFTPLPHRSSTGVTVNHWKKGLAVSLYVKDEHWYMSKLSRMTKIRNINLSNTDLSYYSGSGNIIRYEITMFGFDAIHNSSYHNLIDSLDSFLNNQISRLNESPHFLTSYAYHTTMIQEDLPKCMYDHDFESKEFDDNSLSEAEEQAFKDVMGTEDKHQTNLREYG